MKTPTDEKLHQLLADFDVARLGDGDLNAGTNVLAAMACVVANIQRPGACISHQGTSRWDVGSSLLASGPLTSDLIRERVVAPLLKMQTNLQAQIREWKEDILQITESSGSHKPDLGDHVIKADIRLLATIQDGQPFRETIVSRLFINFPNRIRHALLEQPAFLATGAPPARLRQQLDQSHLGRPLVYDVLRDSAHCAALGACCLPVIDGASGGNALVCDPSRVLDGEITSGAASWLSRLFWLVDSPAGPALSPPASFAQSASGMQTRFEHAVLRGLTARYDHETISAPGLTVDISAVQSQWVAFLARCEAGFPGISATARTLLPTLIYGLNHLRRDAGKPSAQPAVSPGEVLALAMHLAMRMGNARAALAYSGANERRARWRGRIIDHLDAGPLGIRDLSRRFHRMTTNECRDLLDDLKRSGQVMEIEGGLWQLSVPSERPRAAAITLDVA